MVLDWKIEISLKHPQIRNLVLAFFVVVAIVNVLCTLDTTTPIDKTSSQSYDDNDDSMNE